MKMQTDGGISVFDMAQSCYMAMSNAFAAFNKNADDLDWEKIPDIDKDRWLYLASRGMEYIESGSVDGRLWTDIAKDMYGFFGKPEHPEMEWDAMDPIFQACFEAACRHLATLTVMEEDEIQEIAELEKSWFDFAVKKKEGFGDATA